MTTAVLWIIPVVCMIPAAASDLKYRSVSLESCVGVLLGGGVVFGLYAVQAPIHEVATSALVTGAISASAYLMRKRGGDGDWWFVAGLSMALVTIDVMVMVLAMVCGMGMIQACHVFVCAKRPGLPYPRRLYQYVKRKGDRFCVDVRTGQMVADDHDGTVVYPGLPMVTFLAVSAVLFGVIYSV